MKRILDLLLKFSVTYVLRREELQQQVAKVNDRSIKRST